MFYIFIEICIYMCKGLTTDYKGERIQKKINVNIEK